MNKMKENRVLQHSLAAQGVPLSSSHQQCEGNMFSV